MKTFSRIVKARRNTIVADHSPEEHKWMLQSLVNITLGYYLNGNIGMFKHAMGVDSI
jgi:hypothetical protein